MKNEFEKIFDNIAASAVPESQDYTDKETGWLHCNSCHTPKEYRVEIFGKTKRMPCTCGCKQEQLAAEEQRRKEQQRLDRKKPTVCRQGVVCLHLCRHRFFGR